MAMDKMKLYVKSKATFSPNVYFWKACTYLTKCMDIFLWALTYFASKMRMFTEHICNRNLPYFFAELLSMLSNLTGIQNSFCAIIPAHKHVKGNKYKYCNKVAKWLEFHLNSLFRKRLYWTYLMRLPKCSWRVWISAHYSTSYHC